MNDRNRFGVPSIAASTPGAGPEWRQAFAAPGGKWDAERARRLDTVAKRWRASDVARLRDALLKSWERGQLMKILGNHPPEKMNTPVHLRDAAAEQVLHWSQAEWHDYLISILPDAPLYYVAEDMTELVKNAAAAAPAYQVFADKLPSQSGFVVFEHPFCEVPPEVVAPGQRIELVAALWHTVPDVGGIGESGNGEEAVPGVMVVTLQDSGVLWWTQPIGDLPATRAEMRRFLAREVELSGPLAYHEEYPVPFGDRAWGTEPGTSIKNTAVAAMQTTWNLMHQRITEVREEAPPRHKVEKAAKRGERPPPAVRVVSLAPRPARKADADRQETREGEPSRRYTRRWTVQGYGYWRDTWYPSKGRHEQQWVEVDSYVKGPEGAPWVPPKVRALRDKK